MAVAKLKLLSVIGVKEKLDDVVSVLGSSGAFHTEDVLSLYSDTQGFTPISADNIYEKPMNDMIALASEVGKVYKECDEADDIVYDDVIEYIKELKSEINNLTDRKQEINQQYNSLLSSRKKISSFVGLNINFQEITKCDYIKIRLGRLPNDSVEKLERYKDNPYVLFFTSVTDQMYNWGMYVAPIDHVDEVDNIFAGLSFERLRIYDVETTPEAEIKNIDRKIEDLHGEYDEVLKKLDKVWEDNFDKASGIFSWLKKRYTYSNIKKQSAEYNRCFALSGWIPEKEEKEIRKKLKKIPAIESLAEDSKEIKDHMVPTKLENKKLFRPFENFVSLYGMPSGKEPDPTIFVTITYALIFGMMFGDFGNGLMLIIAGIVMSKFMNMYIGKILIPCGVVSMMFGVLFGSAFGFGNAFDWLYVDLLGMDHKPIEVLDPDTITIIIYSSVGLGIIFVIIAMLANIYSCIKQRKAGRGLFGANGLCGLIFYVALIGGLLTQMLLGIPIMTVPYILLLIILPLICIMFEPVLGGLVEKKPDWKPESMGEFIMQAFFEMIEVLLSYATNTISYLRIGAYVLVHEGMLLVVFTLAEMGGDPISYWTIVVIGNVAVVGLEALLVSIQTLRLEFYEMFSRFYDGGGIEFTPVTVPSNSEIMANQN